jgi:tyrosine-protein kinase Etk/Wzc
MIPPNSQNGYQKPFNSLDDDTFDIKRYISLFLSNWFWFATFFFIFITIAYGINRYSEKSWTVSSTLLIKDDQLGGSITAAEGFIPGGDYFKSKQNLKNEIGILKSFTLNKRVIDSLPDFQIEYIGVGRRNIVEKKLYTQSPFFVKSELPEPSPGGVFVEIISKDRCLINIIGSSSDPQNVQFGELFQNNKFRFRIYLNDPENFVYDKSLSNKYTFSFTNPEVLADNYRNRLVISPIEENSSLVNLSLSGPVAEQEVDYLNKLMELYIKQGLELKNQTADSTISFIDKQLNLILDSLKDVEKELETFRRDNKLIDLNTEGSLILSRVERYESEKTTAELKKQYYAYLNEYLMSKNESGDIVSPAIMGVTDPELIRLVDDFSKLQVQKSQLALNLNAETGPIRILNAGLERIKSALLENVDGGIKSINSTLTDINARISLVENEIEKLPETQKKMIRIQRRFEVNNTVYTYLLEKRAEAGIAKASNVPDNRIIDIASVFNAISVKPKTRQNYLFALVFGLLIPVIGIILIDFFNDKIIDKTDLEKGTDAPVIGFISHSDSKTETPVVSTPNSTLSESFRSVRTSLKYFIKDNPNPVIAVSSAISSEGKTFISVNLAAITAMLGKKVLLVGLDLRKPRIHKVLGIENGQGLSTYLAGETDYEEAIQPTGIKNLFYAPSGPIPPNPSELIETERMRIFIERSRKEFDYIIIDTPPIAVVTDALLISPYVDMYLLVVRQRYTSKNTLPLIQDLYKNGTLKSLGIVINDISLTGYYGYGLRYGYLMGYGYTYGYNYYGQYSNYRYGYKDKSGGYYSDES